MVITVKYSRKSLKDSRESKENIEMFKEITQIRLEKHSKSCNRSLTKVPGIHSKFPETLKFSVTTVGHQRVLVHRTLIQELASK